MWPGFLAEFTAIAILATTLSLSATPLSPGQSISAAGELDPIGGVTLFQTNVSFTSLVFSGTLTSAVLTNDFSNPFGGLTFTYEFILTSGLSGEAASSISISGFPGDNGFAGFFTDASYQLPTNGIAPVSITRPSSGSIVRFTFTGPSNADGVDIGQNTALLVVQTDANAWTYGNSSILDSSAAANVLTLVPVPEPASAALLAAGGAAFLIYFRRRRQM